MLAARVLHHAIRQCSKIRSSMQSPQFSDGIQDYTGSDYIFVSLLLSCMEIRCMTSTTVKKCHPFFLCHLQALHMFIVNNMHHLLCITKLCPRRKVFDNNAVASSIFFTHLQCWNAIFTAITTLFNTSRASSFTICHLQLPGPDASMDNLHYKH